MSSKYDLNEEEVVVSLPTANVGDGAISDDLSKQVPPPEKTDNNSDP